MEASNVQSRNGSSSKRFRRLNLAAKDPLMQTAHNKIDEMKNNLNQFTVPPADRVVQLAASCFVPFVVYMEVLFITSFRAYDSTMGVILNYFIVMTTCAFSYFIVVRCVRKRSSMWMRWLGIFGCMAATAAFFFGLAIHFNYLLYYYKYSNMMAYSNVAASQPALQFEDAGALMFSEGTTLDRARSIGYRHIRSQKTLCVAPVVDGQMSPTDDIRFFAIGSDCCGWRATFKCDDATTPGTRGALLILKPNQLTSPAFQWVVEDHFDFDAFQKALDLQKAVFAVNAAKDFRLVKWVKDPDAVMDDYRKRGLEWTIISCAAFVAVSIVGLVWHLYDEARRQARELQKFLDAGDGETAGDGCDGDEDQENAF